MENIDQSKLKLSQRAMLQMLKDSVARGIISPAHAQHYWQEFRKKKYKEVK
jgi:hypothetical protein